MDSGTQDEHGTANTIAWEVQYRSPDGYACKATISGELNDEFLLKAQEFLERLLRSQAKGCGPEPVPEAEQKAAATTGQAADTRICPIHNVAMRRYEKDGRAWYSHRTQDGVWCSGKQTRVPNESGHDRCRNADVLGM